MVDRVVNHEVQTDFQQACEHYAAGQLREAHHALCRHLARHGECGRGWELLGLVYHACRQWPQAMAALEEASIRSPLSCLGESALGGCYLATDRPAWARSLFHHVLSRRDVVVRALLGAAAGLDALNEPTLSVEACRRAIQLDSESAQAFFDLSYYLGRCGAPETRIEATARKAIDLAPDNILFRVGLAGFLHSRGRSESAAVLVARLSVEQVQSMKCPCCLGRLIGVLEAVGDEERAAWCRQRKEFLALSNEATHS